MCSVGGWVTGDLVCKCKPWNVSCGWGGDEKSDFFFPVYRYMYLVQSLDNGSCSIDIPSLIDTEIVLLNSLLSLKSNEIGLFLVLRTYSLMWVLMLWFLLMFWYANVTYRKGIKEVLY